ncbi:MAG: DUF421 domain-containing protein [Gemmatimonadaceae bacterium]
MVTAAAIYVLIVVALRIAGERALAKMSGYDLIVTVALGSLVASIPLTSAISVADGAAAIVTFLVLQEVTRWLQARSRHVHHVVRERPHLVVWDGEFLEDRLKKISMTEDEVRAAVRRTGLLSMTQVQAVVLENDGEWSVLPRSDAKDLSALDGLRIPYLLPPDEDPRRWREREEESGAAPKPAPPQGNPA